MFSPLVARIDPRRCIGCGNCTRACFNHSIEIVLGKAVVLDSQCMGCLFCRTSCPRGAIYATSRFVPKRENENLRIRAAVIRRQLKSIEERLKSISR
ncbi:MAG: 4Fe-4S binding protein [Candidatus Hodarchaeota archaeon]